MESNVRGAIQRLKSIPHLNKLDREYLAVITNHIKRLEFERHFLILYPMNSLDLSMKESGEYVMLHIQRAYERFNQL